MSFQIHRDDGRSISNGDRGVRFKIQQKVGLVLGICALASVGACDRNGSKQAAKLVIEPPLAAEPMTLRAAFTYGGKSYNIPLESVRGSDTKLQPVAIALPGCAFAVWERDAPSEAIMISVDEDPTLIDRPTVEEACLAHDGKALENALSAQLDFMASRLSRLRIADPTRTVVLAFGDAAPVAAAHRLPVRGKILVGDPCLVPWRTTDFDTATPTILLRGAPSGIGWSRPAENPKFQNRESLAKTELDPSRAIAGMVEHCPALPRPVFPANVSVTDWSGEVSTLKRPSGMLEAQKAAFRRYVGDS